MPSPTTAPPGARRGLTLATICVPMFLVLLDVTIVNVALPELGADLALAQPALAIDAYTLPLAAALLPAGWASDRLGPRRPLVAGLAVFGAASLACALAPGAAVLLAGRVGQGLGAAAMLPAGLAVLQHDWAGPARARALGIWSGVSAAGTALGPGLGGLLTGLAGWRMIFLINLAPLALALVGAVVLVRDPRGGEEPAGRRVLPGRLAAASVAAFAMNTVGNGTLLTITWLAQRAYRLPVAAGGALLLVATVPFAALSPLGGRALARFGPRVMIMVGFVTGAAMLASLYAATPGADWPALMPPLLGVGVALAALTPAIVAAGLAALPGRPGLAGGIGNTCRQLGTSFGVALAGVLVASADTPGAIAAGAHRFATVAIVAWLLGAAVVAVGLRAPGVPAPE
ncbi:MFS transporter [Naumannella huperziae]